MIKKDNEMVELYKMLDIKDLNINILEVLSQDIFDNEKLDILLGREEEKYD